MTAKCCLCDYNEMQHPVLKNTLTGGVRGFCEQCLEGINHYIHTLIEVNSPEEERLLSLHGEEATFNVADAADTAEAVKKLIG